MAGSCGGGDDIGRQVALQGRKICQEPGIYPRVPCMSRAASRGANPEYHSRSILGFVAVAASIGVAHRRVTNSLSSRRAESR